MVQRCYEDYGPVFTVPVSLVADVVVVPMTIIIASLQHCLLLLLLLMGGVARHVAASILQWQYHHHLTLAHFSLLLSCLVSTNDNNQ
jgi:hypothetical protein